MVLMYLDFLNLLVRVLLFYGFGLEVYNVLYLVEFRDFLVNEFVRNKINILNKFFGIMVIELIINDICVRNDYLFNY